MALAAVATCGLLRLAAQPRVGFDADEAVTGLMVHRILDGHGYPFFAGQNYMGTLEQYVQAAFLSWLPASTLTLRLTQIVLSCLSCLLVFLVGRSVLAAPWRAAFAAVLFAIGPAFSVVWGVKSRGAYDAVQVLGLLGLLLALRRPTRSVGRSRADVATAAGFGLCCGLALWLSLSAALLLVPAAVWFLAPPVRGWRYRVVPALVGTVLGALPAELWALTHHILPTVAAQPPSTVGDRLLGFLDPVLGEFLGLRAIDRHRLVPAAVAGLVIAGLAGCWLVAAWRRRRGLRDLLTMRTGRRTPGDLLLLAIAVIVLLYVASPYSWYTGEPRYLFPAYPLLALGLAAVVPARRSLALPVAALAVAAVGLSTAVTLARVHSTDPAHRADFDRLATALHRQGVDAAYGDYWTAMPIDFVEYGRLTVAPLDGADRFPDLRRSVDRAQRTAYVVSSGLAPGLADAFDRAGVGYRTETFGSVIAFTRLRGPYRPWQLGAGNPPWG